MNTKDIVNVLVEALENAEQVSKKVDTVFYCTINGVRDYHYGLCSVISCITASLAIRTQVKFYLHNRLHGLGEKEKKASDFSGFWWPKGELKPRLDFIKRIQEELNTD